MTTNAVAVTADPFVGKWVKLRTLTALALAALGFTAVPARGQAAVPPTIDRDAFLRAVAEVETGGNTRAVGRRGERGLYQFTRATWQRHSSRPFAEAHNSSVAYSVAVRHFTWLRDRFVTAGTEPTAYRMAVAWNAGLGRALSGSAPRSTRDYARRVTNLAGLHRPPVHQPAPAPVASAVASSTTPIARPVSMPVVFAQLASEAIPISFSLDRAGAFAVDLGTPDVAVEPADEITFTLARSVAPSGATEASATAAPPRRLIFATIGE